MTGWEVKGLEKVHQAAVIARAKGLQILECDIEEAGLSKNSIDVITLWDVLEHMPDPASVLKECYNLLGPTGTLIIKSPDPSGREASMFGEYWVGYEAPQHIFGFPKPVLMAKLKELDFDVLTKQTGSDYAAFCLSLAYWLRSKKLVWLSKVLITSVRIIPGRLIAGILVRPLRWIGINSSCTYYAIKKK